jgi:large subunit ribosomal protein L25
MEVGKLNVTLRTRTGKGGSRALRRQGFVPGTCYGAGLEAPINITVHPKELRASLDPAKGRNTVIDVTLEGTGPAAGRRLTAMLWEYQVDPVRHSVTHVDLIAIDPDKEVHVDVPLEVTGKAAGIVEGGQIHLVRYTIPVRCKPADIPVKFVLDVTPLHIGEVLHASDLVPPPGVSVSLPADVGLVTCAAPTMEKEPTPEEAALAATAAGVEGAPPPEAATGDDKKGDDKKGGEKKADAGSGAKKS